MRARRIDFIQDEGESINFTLISPRATKEMEKKRRREKERVSFALMAAAAAVGSNQFIAEGGKRKIEAVDISDVRELHAIKQLEMTTRCLPSLSLC